MPGEPRSRELHQTIPAKKPLYVAKMISMTPTESSADESWTLFYCNNKNNGQIDAEFHKFTNNIYIHLISSSQLSYYGDVIVSSR